MLSGVRLSELFQTLRFRLTAWITVVVTLMVVLTMVTVREVVVRRLQDEFDHELIDNVKLVIAPAIEKLYPTQPTQLVQDIDSKVSLSPERHWFVVLYDARSEYRWASKNTPGDLPADYAGRSPRLFDHGNVRIMEVPAGIPVAEGQPGLPLYIRSGCSRDPLNEDIELVNRIMLLASSLIILVLPLSGFVLAGRATRPIAWIISTAARLQPSHLNERLPIRGTGDELDQLSQTINGMLDRIASYIESTQEFVADAAHELRSPLAAIRSTVEVGLNRNRTPEEYTALLTDVMEECTRLSTLVNRMLLLAEGDAGLFGTKDQTVYLDKIVRESLDMFEAAAEAQGVVLRAGELAAVRVPGDEYHLRQVVRNLIDNAIKFSLTTGTITVVLRTDLVHRQAVLTIEDQGIGIAPELQPHIFERFYRVDKSRNRLSGRGGTGLGLAICRSIVTALKGEISVSSQTGRGSTFTVRLPMLADALHAAPEPLAHAASALKLP